MEKGLIQAPLPIASGLHASRGDNEEKQRWLMGCYGRNLKQISHIPDGLGAYLGFFFDFAWSPDSKHLAFSHQPYQPRWERKQPPQSTITLIDLAFSHQPYQPRWERKQPPQSTITLIDISAHQLTQLGSFDSSIHFLSWLPNGEELLFVEERVGFFYQKDKDREWIRALRITDGSLRTLAEFDGLQPHLEPIASLDGRQIALMYDAENPLLSIMPSLCLISNHRHVKRQHDPSLV